MKIAPEHTAPHVLAIMGKQPVEHLLKFKQQFDSLSRKAGKPQFLTYYLIAAHPGCCLKDMQDLKRFCIENLKTIPEQVQIFTPTPSTWSTLMYYTETDPFSGKPLFVEKDPKEKEKQKQAVTAKPIRKKYRK
jgi:radical SAM superfamily enzyme YgiQ (UPF0313 family)